MHADTHTTTFSLSLASTPPFNPANTSSTLFLHFCLHHSGWQAASRRLRCRTPPTPAGWAACCAPAGRRASGTVWSAPRWGCAGRPASESSWHKAAVLLGGEAGCRPAGSLTVGLGGLQFVRDPAHRGGLRERRVLRNLWLLHKLKSNRN